MEEAFALVAQAEAAAQDQRHGEASNLFVDAVNSFQGILSTIKDDRSRSLIHDQCNEFRRRAVAEQDLADARRLDKEADFQARLDALKGGGGAGAEAALRESRKGNGNSTVADLEARFDSLRGPQKRAPMAEEIQARLKALGGTTEFPDYMKEKRAEEARLNALVSQIADVDGGNNNNDTDEIDDEKLKALVASALGQTDDFGGGAMGTDFDMSNTLVAAGTDFLEGGGGGDDNDLVEQIVRQAKDELRYGNASDSGAVEASQTGGEASAEKEKGDIKSGSKKSRSRRKGRRQRGNESDYDSEEEDESSDGYSDDDSDRDKRNRPKSRTWFGFRR